MITLQQLAEILRKRIDQLELTQEALASSAGVSRQTLSNVLSGRSDLRVTTLMALADRLGLELMLVPREVAPGMMPQEEDGPRIKSVVDTALSPVLPTQESKTGRTS